VKYLKFLGIKKIIGIDINEKKLNFAKKMGCSKVINSSHINLKKKIFDYANKGVDYIYECSGNAKQISKMFEMLNSSGTLSLIGVPKIGTKSEFNTLEINLGKKIIGNKGGDFYAKKHLSKYENIITSKQCGHKKFITEVIRLKDLNTFFLRMAKGKILGKGIISFI
jgi:Zn-dependent alcohol dehydrogenase